MVIASKSLGTRYWWCLGVGVLVLEGRCLVGVVVTVVGMFATGGMSLVPGGRSDGGRAPSGRSFGARRLGGICVGTKLISGRSVGARS